MKQITGFLIFSLMLLLMSCRSGNKESNVVSIRDAEFYRVEINLDGNYYDSVFNLVSTPKIVMLKENDATMFADMDRLIARNGKFYILDSFGSRKVVSFSKDGTPLNAYGNIGEGPGEYVRPWDIDVDETGVYILDSNLKKVIRYNEEGKYISERSIPFIADAFHLLDDGKILFSLLPDGEGGARLCITDSMMNVKNYTLPSEKDYIGGWRTNDVFRENKNGILYYKAPLDTLFIMNGTGDIYSGMIFDFDPRAVPEEAKKDYLQAREDGKLKGKLKFVNNPISIANGLMAALVDADESQYTIIFDPANNRCGGRKSDDMQSIYDMMGPISSDENGDLICYTSIEYARDLEGFESLDSITRQELGKYNRMLLIYPFSQLKR